MDNSPSALSAGRRRLVLLCCVALALVAVAFSATTMAESQRQVTGVDGQTVDVPAQPKRVITLGIRDLDSALALGVEPAGTTAGRGQSGAPGYLADRVQSVPVVGQFMQPSLGRIIELQPDLILAGGIADSRMIKQLRQIAPTVVTYHLGDNWQKAFHNVAEALGRQDAAAAFMDKYHARTARLKERLGSQSGAAVSIVRWQSRGPSIMLRDSFSSKIIATVGLQRPATQQQAGVAHTPPLSLEALERIDGDWIFIGTLDGEGDSALATIRQRPVFSALSAVQAGHVTFVDGSLWTSGGGPLAAMAILDDVQDAMTGS